MSKSRMFVFSLAHFSVLAWVLNTGSGTSEVGKK